MSEHPNQVTLVAETFKFPLNFDFNTKLSHDLLAMFKNASNEFFEITEISNIIDWVFNKYMRYFILMNSFHTLQAILCSFFIFHKEVYALRLAMRTVATLNILAELIQISHDPCDYLGDPLNYLELIGNSLVILVQFDMFESVTWVMVLLIMVTAVLNLRIFS